VRRFCPGIKNRADPSRGLEWPQFTARCRNSSSGTVPRESLPQFFPSGPGFGAGVWLAGVPLFFFLLFFGWGVGGRGFLVVGLGRGGWFCWGLWVLVGGFGGFGPGFVGGVVFGFWWFGFFFGGVFGFLFFFFFLPLNAWSVGWPLFSPYVRPVLRSSLPILPDCQDTNAN